MEVILMERIAKLGQMGDVVNVKPGFARNYLLPKGKARRATKENIAHFETQKAQLETQNLERRADAEAVAGKMNDVSVVLVRQAGEAGQLYGSVNARDIADAVTKAGYDVNRNQVSLDQPIKMLGLHPVVVNLHPEVSVEVIANVARSEAEAERQAAGEDINAEAEDDLVMEVFDDTDDADDDGEEAAADDASDAEVAEADVSETEDG